MRTYTGIACVEIADTREDEVKLGYREMRVTITDRIGVMRSIEVAFASHDPADSEVTVEIVKPVPVASASSSSRRVR